MNAKELHMALTAIIEDHGDIEVMVDTATFPESENGTVMQVESVGVKQVQGTDDSGPVGDKHPMLVITGAVEWHEHGTPL